MKVILTSSVPKVGKAGELKEVADGYARNYLIPRNIGYAATPEQRRRYIATFYTSRFWAHPGAFAGAGEVEFHTEPFADAAHLRASFGGYESSFHEHARSEPSILGANTNTPTLILHGPSDHVIYPAFDRMAHMIQNRD